MRSVATSAQHMQIFNMLKTRAGAVTSWRAVGLFSLGTSSRRRTYRPGVAQSNCSGRVALLLPIATTLTMISQGDIVYIIKYQLVISNSQVHLFQNTLRPQKNCNRIVLNGFVFSNYLKTTYTKSAKIESAIAA